MLIVSLAYAQFKGEGFAITFPKGETGRVINLLLINVRYKIFKENYQMNFAK